MELDHLGHIKNAADLGAVATIFGVFMGLMPHLAALFTVAWLAMRFYNELMTAVYAHRKNKLEDQKSVAFGPPEASK